MLEFILDGVKQEEEEEEEEEDFCIPPSAPALTGHIALFSLLCFLYTEAPCLGPQKIRPPSVRLCRVVLITAKLRAA